MTGGFGPSCDRGDGGDGSSGSSSRLLRPPKLPSPLAFASELERGAGGGIGGGGCVVVVVEAMQGEVVIGCSFCVVMGATRKSFYHQKQFHRSIFLDPLPPNRFHGTSFLPTATSSSMTLWNRRTRKTLHGSSFSPFATSDAHD